MAVTRFEVGKRRGRAWRRAWAAAGCVALAACGAVSPGAHGGTVTWVVDADGAWTAATNWSSAPLLPGAADDVTISVAGDRLVTLSGAAQSIGSLTLGERLTISGTTLTLATAQLNNTLTLAGGGTLKGGAINGGGTIVATSGVLDGVALAPGVGVDLTTQNNANLTVRNGLLVYSTISLGNNGTSGATYGTLYFGDSTANPAGTVSGTGTILLGSSTSNSVYNYSSGTGTAGALTIGSGITIHGKAGQVDNVYGTGTIVNQGKIAADVAGGAITFGGTGTVQNRGTLSVTNGASLTVGGTWTNASGGTIRSDDSTLTLGTGAGAWSNAGTITANNSAVKLGGSFTQAGLGTFIRNGGTVSLVGTLTGNLTLNGTTGSWNIVGGTVRNGTYSATGGAGLVVTSATFDGVTVNSPMDLTPVSNSNVTVKNGLVLNSTVNLGKADGTTYGTLYFSDASAAPAGSLTGTGTVLFGGSASNTVYNYSSASGTNGTFTIGPGITIHGKGGTVGNVYASGTIVNQGAITANVAGGTVTVGSNGSLVNQGALSATNGATLAVTSAWTNAAGGTITSTASSLKLGSAGDAWSNLGTISATDSAVTLNGNFTQAGMGTFNRTGGSVTLAGVLTGDLALSAATGSWNVNGGTVRSGTYSATVGASLAVQSGTFDGVTVAAGAGLDLSAASSSSLTVRNGLVLNGTMNLGSADGTTYGNLYFGEANANPAGSLTGTGTLVLGGSASNNVYNYSTAIGAAGTLTIGPRVTIRGKTGHITNVYSTATLVNQGTVSADVSGGTVTFGDSSGAVVNNGTLAVSNGGTLAIGGTWGSTGTISVNNGTLNLGGSVTSAGLGLGGFARTGGTVNLTGVLVGDLPLTAVTGDWNLVAGTVQNGTYSSAGGATLVARSGVLDNVRVAAGATLDLTAVNNANVSVRNSLALDGTMLLGKADGSTYGVAHFGDGSGTPAGALTGGGTVVLGGSASSELANSSNAVGEAGVLTIGAGVTVHGKNGGVDNDYATGEIVNNGSIVADVSGGTLKVGSTGTFTNNGAIGVQSGATLTLGGTAGSWSNAGAVTVNGGTLNMGGNFATISLGVGGFVRTGGTVNLTGTLDNFGSTLALSAATGDWNLAGGTIHSGTFTAGGGAGLRVKSGVLDGVTLDTGADLTTVNNANVAVLNSLVLNGTMPVGAADGSTYGVVKFGDRSATTPAGNLIGTGTIVLGGSASNTVANDSGAVGGPGTLTIGSGITIHGKSGTVDNSFATGKFVNQGTIAADVAGGTVKVGGTGTLTNAATGVLSAANGGTLTVGGVWSNAGTLSVDNGTMNLGGTFTTTGLGLAKFTRNGGTVNLTGTLTGNLPLTATTGGWTLLGGLVKNGTYSGTGGAVLSVRSGTFDGVTVGSDLDVTPVNNSNLTVKNGLVLTGGATVGLGRTDGTTYGSLHFGDGTTAPAGALSGAGAVVFGGSTNNAISNDSTGLATAGTLTIGSGVTVRGSSGLISSAQATGTVLNQGLISADTAGGTITLGGSSFTNAGTIEAAGGNLTINAGNFVNNGILRVSNGTLGFNAAVSLTSGQGSAVTMTGGTLRVDNALALPGFDLSAGTIAGSGTMSASVMTWAAGGMSGSGKTVVPADGNLTISGAAAKSLARKVDNAGTTAWTDGQVLMNGATFTNLSGGVFNASAANSFFNSGGTNAFVNAGAFSKTSSSVTVFGVPFNNLPGGTVIVNDGTLVFGGGGTNSGSIEVAAGATARFSGSYVHAAGSSLVSHGNLDFNAATISLDGNLTIDGQLSFDSTSATVKANTTANQIALINSTATVAAGGVLNVGPGGISFGGTNNNTVTLQPSATTPGKLVLGGNVAFTATGGSGALNTADFTVSQTPGLLDLGGAARTFTVNDAPAAIDLAVSARVVNGALIKSGPGTLRLDSPNSYAGGTTVNAGTLEVIDTAALGGGAVAVGDATLSLKSDAASPVVFGSSVNVVGDATVRVDRISTGTTGTFRLGAVAVGNSRWSVTGANRSLEVTGLNLGGAGSTAVPVATLDTSVPLTINGPITQAAPGWGFTKSTGLAKLTIGGTTANTYTGPTRVNDGAVDLNKPPGVMAIGGDLALFGGTVKLLADQQIADTSNVTVANSGTLLDLAGRSETVASLTMTGGTVTTGTAVGGPFTVFRATALALSNAAKFDLGNNRLIVDYAPGPSPAASIRAAILSAKGTGNWAGPGLTSTLLATPANAARNALGFAEASGVLSPAGGTFAGQTVDGSAILVRYTVQGDASLDGAVNFDDLLLLAKNYNATGAAVTWGAGDFDYSGTVNFDDLLILAKNYNAVLPTEPIPGAPANFAADLAAAFAQAVPEPVAGAVMGTLIAGTMLGRRRRHRSACAE